MGLVGALMGCALGVGVQMLIPRVLGDFLPVGVTISLSWGAILLGIGIGVGVTLLFALLPLVSIRRISPLLALRSSVEAAQPARRDPLRWGLYAFAAVGVTIFAVVQAPNPLFGLGYAAGLGVVFGLLALVARGIMVLTRKFFPSRWAYVWRQGLANLYRPNNQTLLMMLALGLGTFLIMTMYLVQQTLVNQVQISGGAGRPNLVFFDIQPDQIDGLSDVVEAEGLPVLDRVPIVTMRIHAVKGRTVEEMRADTTTRTSWAHRREYRSTYRDHLTDSETVVAGEFEGTMPEDRVPEGGGVVPISIEQDIADNLEVGLGDEVVFDVQGLLVTARVSSIRTVEWRQMQTNFFVVFPVGVLEDAPQFNVLLTNAPTDEASAAVQSAVVQAYPNVSSIDLTLVLNVFDAIFSRIAFVVRFMALFSILTGLIVLAGAVVVSRYQCIEESVLLKTLGASRKQVRHIMMIEYLFLGVFATATGLVLALAAGWALAYFVFEAPFIASPLALLVALVVVVSLTILIGLFNSRGIYDRPPLEVLRLEA
jgi:putative ABC transport system permease protein